MRSLTLSLAALLLTLLLAGCVVAPLTPPPAELESAAVVSGTSADVLVGPVWQWQNFTNPVEAYDVPDPSQYTIAFAAEGTVAIQADCNRAAGSYVAETGRITITLGPMTLAACPPESLSDIYLQHLGRIVSYWLLDDGRLLLEQPYDSGTLIFAAEGTELPEGAADQLSTEQLMNATYTGIYTEPVTLVDGLYEGEPFVEGGAARPTVMLPPALIAHGDLDGDGIADAAVLLAESSGGSGVFTYVGAQLNDGGTPVDAGTVLLGDRVQVRNMSIENQQVIVGMVTQGPDEPMCCGTLLVTKMLALQDGRLVEVGSQEEGNVSLDSLMGTNWVLSELNPGQPVPADVEITASFAEGRIAGSDGCNRYGGEVSSSGGQALTVGPLMSTMMACPEPVMTTAATYTAALQQAVQWGYLAGQLAIIYQEDDGAIGTLLYAPAPVE